MKKMLLVALLMAFGLSACGVKGALYFPAQSEQIQNP